jgi:hypothetical protein
MLINAKAIIGCALDSLDGQIGKVKGFYFDDRHWTIRYLVADTGTWLPIRKVLISPHALAATDTVKRLITVTLTRKQIEESPSLDSEKSISRQFEEEYYKYYTWPFYWVGQLEWGNYPHIVRDFEKKDHVPEDEKKVDSHLYSTDTVSGFHIQAIDGEIGHVDDFMIDDETWAIRYLVIDTHNWWPGKKVLISPNWIDCVTWNKSKVYVHLQRATIKLSPEYTDCSMLTREFEAELHRYYNRKGYWAEEPTDKPTIPLS